MGYVQLLPHFMQWTEYLLVLALVGYPVTNSL